MAKAREIKKRIHAVRTTKKITRTMEMVSTSKLKKFQNVVLASRPYSQALKEVLQNLSNSPAAKAHPLMEKREPAARVGLLVITSNRGLCGAFNNNICRQAQKLHADYLSQGSQVELFSIGKKGSAYFRHLNLEPVYRNTSLTDQLNGEEAGELAVSLIKAFLTRKLDRVDIVYCRFVSAGQQKVTVEQLLPLSLPTDAKREEKEVDFIFEPSTDEIVDTLLPLYARSSVYRALAENIASEHAARRRAMKLATDNADEMITFLTRRFNRARQAQITQELTEIIGGSNAIV
jgi:F-type H+-transporting ATPase subunit gamma